MRILTVTNLYPPDVIGGYELGCRQMVGALRERGHEVLVLASRARRPVPPEPGVRRELRLDFAGPPVDSANVAALVEVLESFRPDVVYLWNVTLVGPLGLAGALAYLQAPVVWHLMDDVPRSAATSDGHVVSSVARVLGRRLRARYLCCSQRLVDEIAEAGFDFAGRETLLANWVDTADIDRTRPLYPAAGARLRIVAAGQLAPHKGVDLIIDAARGLVERGHSGFDIDLYGSGLDDHYRQSLLGTGLGQRVRLCGTLPHAELIERFWDYDVFLFPTWAREPFAFAPLEAAVRGCVPVLSENCGNAEWFVGGVHCLKVARSAPAIEAALAAIIECRVALEPIAARAQRTIRDAFSLDHAVASVEGALHQAMALPANRPGHSADTYHLARFAERLRLEMVERG